MCGACNTHGRDEKCVQHFTQKTLKEETLGNYRHKYEDSIRIDVKDVGCLIMNL